jgi:hypothetical protein
MADQIFKTPGFYPREIDLTRTSQQPTGVPAGVIGSSLKGPAFVPVVVGTFSDFVTTFGELDSKHPSTYTVQKFLESKNAVSFVRVLGAGANTTIADIDTTRTQGTVTNAGFKVSSSFSSRFPGDAEGSVYFIGGKHVLTGSEAYGMPMFTDNASFLSSGASDEVFLVRGVLFAASGTRLQVLDWNQSYSEDLDSFAAPSGAFDRSFKLAISTSVGTSFANSDGFAGVRIVTASLDPTSVNYIAKVLNTNPEKFGTEYHVLYGDYAVDAELASINTGSADLFLASGSANTTTTGGDTSSPFRQLFGRFDTRFTTPSTPWFISQPFGKNEYRLFKIFSKDDGAYANNKYKVSIVNVKKSTDLRNKYGTFSLVVRAFDDNDYEPQVVEQFNNLSLNPSDDNYIAKVVGDSYASFNFDVVDERDKRLQQYGIHQGQSKYIRVEMDESLNSGFTPPEALPFGYEGYEVLSTNPTLLDNTGSAGSIRLGASGSGEGRLLGAIVPPLPYRFKLTRGSVDTTGTWRGAPGNLEVVDRRLFWGVKDSRNNNVVNPNVSSEPNPLVESYTKFAGISKLDTVVTGAFVNRFNSNKFTLARVALYNQNLADVTSSVETHIRQAAYIRDGEPDVSSYKITDGTLQRVTFATLLNKGTSAADFNKFSDFTKFTALMAGGFDGTNILDKNAATFNDRSTSTEARGTTIGNANAAFTSPGFGFNQNATGILNNSIFAFRTATDIMTDPLASSINLLAVPGQREPLVTDYVADAVATNGLILYTMDVPSYNVDIERVFDGEGDASASTRADVQNTADQFELRALDNSYVAPYFPNIIITDMNTQRRVVVPASVAAFAAIGFNDKVAYPWYAPAGFNRAALSFVERTTVRINQPDQERLADVRINPIVKFPREGYVIFSQNTLDNERTALQRINVKRLLLDLKRQVIGIGNSLIWEQITPELRQRLSEQLRRLLSEVQTNGGIEFFDVICDNRNNTQADADANRLNCQIRLVPVKAVEFIAIDFIVTNSGVEFQ